MFICFNYMCILFVADKSNVGFLVQHLHSDTLSIDTFMIPLNDQQIKLHRLGIMVFRIIN